MEEAPHSRRNLPAVGVGDCCSHKVLVVEEVRCSCSLAEEEACRSRTPLAEGKVVVSSLVEGVRIRRAVGRRTRFVQGKTTFKGAMKLSVVEVESVRRIVSVSRRMRVINKTQ